METLECGKGFNISWRVSDAVSPCDRESGHHGYHGGFRDGFRVYWLNAEVTEAQKLDFTLAAYSEASW